MQTKTVNRLLGVGMLGFVLTAGWLATREKPTPPPVVDNTVRALPLQKAQTYKDIMLPSKIGLYHCAVAVVDRVGNSTVLKFESEGWINRQQKYFTANFNWFNETSGPLSPGTYRNGTKYVRYSNSSSIWTIDTSDNGKYAYTYERKGQERFYYFSNCKFKGNSE
ncbi:TPA: hypothetical protein JG946_003749 [Enterobacter hormaechei subsp. steigerwaltii]|nr:hypothetical protein [Enterobacter hormaechei subsp. steigerwaltii]